MELRFEGEIWYWRGPAPWLFVTVPDDGAAAIHQIAARVTYGWGVIPATVRIGDTEFTTSLFPKDGGYLVPIKRVVQDAEQIDVGDVVEIELTISS
ncbi:MAG: DUF1905 domain-containing protein [Actinomycetota bacterium]|nr:DUF1905 domain-containing protein [Actinomycetota bacterium]